MSKFWIFFFCASHFASVLSFGFMPPNLLKTTAAPAKTTTKAAAKKGGADVCSSDPDVAKGNAPPELVPIFDYIDANSEKFIENLREAVAIPSVSAQPDHREDVIKMMEWIKEKLEAVGGVVELRPIERTEPCEGDCPDLPPVLLAHVGDDTSKKTVMVYGHADVQPGKKSDGWSSEPFTLTETDDGRLVGRGATDDKGPIVSWLNALEAYKETKTDIPVNIKFIFEPTEESGSEGLNELVNSEKDGWFKDIDMVCISDNYWVGKTRPCITYGIRGLVYFFIEIEGSSKDLHSGEFGGTMHEAMADLIYMLDRLVDKKGKIMIPGIQDSVLPVTDEERALYAAVEFDLKAYQKEAGVFGIRNPDNKTLTLMNRWRYPSLSIHGIEGAYSEPGAKTVIPKKVIGKFSIRLVPEMVPGEVEALVKKYLNDIWKKRKSPNKMKPILESSGRPWVTDPKNAHFTAAADAAEMVWGCKPSFTRMGGSIPITLTFAEATGKSVLLLPVGTSDDGAHSQNEKVEKINYLQGTKTMAAYLFKLGSIGDI